MGFVEKDGLRYYQFDIFKGQPMFHAILTRAGGYSKEPFDSLNFGGTVGDDPQDVLKNHQLVYEKFGYDFDSRFDVWQVHGTKVLCTDEPREVGALHQKADGILTDRPEVTLFMRFADCVPILMFDPVHKVVGIAHAGWQGSVQQIARYAVEKMVNCYGSRPEEILAGIGPSICQSCYSVGREVFEKFSDRFGAAADAFFEYRDGKYHLDLWEVNRQTLTDAGVRQIEIAEICTACNLADWYSHRAENGKTGRFGVIMSLEG